MVATEIRVPLTTGWPPQTRGLISMRSLMLSTIPASHGNGKNSLFSHMQRISSCIPFQNKLFVGCSLTFHGWFSHPHRNQRWEPRENRGRLRHCDGLQTPIATGSIRNREGGSKVRDPVVRTSARLRSSGPARAGPLLRQREG